MQNMMLGRGSNFDKAYIGHSWLWVGGLGHWRHLLLIVGECRTAVWARRDCWCEQIPVGGFEHSQGQNGYPVIQNKNVYTRILLILLLTK